MILEPYVGTPPRRAKMIFIKQNLVKAFGFVPTQSLLFYENLFYIRNQEDKRSNVCLKHP
jgi:hypothetical protein